MNLYHVINRSIDGRNLFLDSQDYARFVHNLYEFNDTSPALEFHRAESRALNVGFPKPYIRKRLVEIHGWELMKDHYHLIISELIKGGLVKFMRKMNVGYANYYNERHKKHGHVFRGKTRKIPIVRQEHFLYILHYIHLNSLDYLSGAKKWRERDKSAISNIPKIFEYLKTYRWSSYLDYCSKKNFPSILTKSFFDGSLDASYVSSLKEYLMDRIAEGSDLKTLEY